jgi:cell division protein FtsQ
MKVIRKILIIFGWLCLVGLIGFSIYFVYSQRENVRCKTIVVNISPDSPRFMDEEEITQMIEKSGEPIIGHRLFDINIYKLESKLNSYSTLKDVEIYRKAEAHGLSFNGKLIINLAERTPVLRIKSSNDDYYLARDGVQIPVSSKYIERIVIASGIFPDDTIKSNLLKMTDWINQDEFWKAQIEQILIQPNGELLLIPQVGDYIIEFGKPEEYQIKFRNLKAVYQQGFKNFGWNKYKAISVKYQNQVVCTKK